MNQEIHLVITDCGDGSNSIEWVTDQAVLDKMEELADEGDESYASGDGLQVRTLKVPDVAEFVRVNNLSVTTMEDMEDRAW